MPSFAIVSSVLATMLCRSALGGDERPMPSVGDLAPPILVETVYAPDGAFPVAEDFTWSELAGQVVVVEFTASWCGSCLQALPHLNELALEFRDAPVVFVSLSSESDATCRKLQAEHRFETIFCRDADASVFHDYWVLGIPHLVVIDRRGRIAAITHPHEVQAKHIRAVLDGESIRLPTAEMQRTNWDVRSERERLAAGADAEPERTVFGGPLDAYVIESARPHVQCNDRENGSVTYVWPLRELITQAYLRWPHSRLQEVDLPLDKTYEVHVRTGVTGAQQWESCHLAMQKMLEASFGYEAAFESRSVSCYVLTRVAGAAAPPASTASQPGIGGDAGRFFARKQPIAKWRMFLEPVLPDARPLVDESGLAGEYDVDLRWDASGGIVALNQALAKLGLAIATAPRTVEMLVLRKARFRQFD